MEKTNCVYMVSYMPEPEWEKVPAVELTHTGWLEPCAITAQAKLCRDDNSLWVRMEAVESPIRATLTGKLDQVCDDSCLEFFVNPCPEAQDKYVNFEINPRGTMHIGVGAERNDRRVLAEMPADMGLSLAKRENDWWAVRYRVTNRLIEELTGHAPEKKMRANFYKCDESIHPHFGSWNPIVHFQPDFHRPEWFGDLMLEPVSGV